MSISDDELMENPRERRPSLARKRPRFSFKPNLSQPTVTLEPSLDIDKLNDPEEFFKAFERNENAKREIQKQTGSDPVNLDQSVRSVAARPRRPGLSRQSVRYTHRFSNSKSPAERIDGELLSPLCDPILELEEELEEDLADSVTKVENNVNQLLDHLLSSDYDGDEAVSLLKERLQIKSIDMEKICLPDLQDIRRIDLKAAKESLTKSRNSISDFMKGITKGTPKRQAESSALCLESPNFPRSRLALISLLKKQNSQSDVLRDPFSSDAIYRLPVRFASPMKNTSKQSDQIGIERVLSVSRNNDRRSPQQQAETSAHHIASPTPPRNPLDSMSLQKKHILQSDSLSCLLSIDNIDKSPRRNAFVVGSIKNQSSQVDSETELNMSKFLRCPILESNQIAIASASSELDGTDFAGPFGKFVNDNVRRFDSCINVVPSGSEAGCINNGLSRPEVDADSQTIIPSKFGGRVEDIPAEAVVSAHIQLSVEGPTMDNSHTVWRESDEANPSMDEDQETDESSKAARSGQELHEQQNKKGKSKPRHHHERKGKKLSQRQSLAGAGTTLDTEGRRRSTRIRSRPLEFWKGERFLYGRIHSSLSTVIGIKYESPAKADGENPTLKVKSFVSDEYKDLVKLAARF